MSDLTPPPAAPLAARDTSPLALSSALDQNPALVYLASLSVGSRRTMRIALEAIAALVGPYTLETCPWHRLRYQHTAAIRTALAESYAPASTNKMLAALRRVLRECWQLGLMSVEEYQRAANIKTIKAERLPKGRALTLGELASLMSACAQDATPAGVRDAALIAVMAQGGPRRAEVAALTRADYTPADGSITIRSGKGNKDRIVYVTSGAQAALADWLTLRGDASGALFCSTTRPGCQAMTPQAILVILQKRGTEASIAPFTPHDLRRTMITRLLDAGADVVSVQRLAGHARPETTARYDRRGEDAKRQAADRLAIPYVPNAGRRTLNLESD